MMYRIFLSLLASSAENGQTDVPFVPLLFLRAASYATTTAATKMSGRELRTCGKFGERKRRVSFF